MSGMNIAEPPRTEIRMSIPKFLTVIPVLKIYDMMGNMQCTLKAAIFNYAKCFLLEYRARNASRVNMGLTAMRMKNLNYQK